MKQVKFILRIKHYESAIAAPWSNKETKLPAHTLTQTKLRAISQDNDNDPMQDLTDEREKTQRSKNN